MVGMITNKHFRVYWANFDGVAEIQDEAFKAYIFKYLALVLVLR
jgi:hypothetical protein